MRKEIAIRTMSGGERSVTGAELDRLAAGFEGGLFTSGSPAYEEARTLWNGMIDRRPAAVLLCASPEDVARAVRFAGDRDLLVSVRGGGHNIAGTAVAEGGLMISLQPLRGIEVDPGRGIATVEAGATLGEVDAATQRHALATPLGVNSTTGVAGLTLGGGFGWISRSLGMTIDNLRSAQIVTADGQLRHATEATEPDLFWGVRGGGGNFGVVTSFEFELHSLGPELLAGLIVHPLAETPELLRFLRELAPELPDESSVFTVLRQAPPLPFLPGEWHGKEVVILAVCHAGDLATGEKALSPLREFGDPIADVVGPKPYVAWQQAFDPLLGAGLRNYWKSHDLLDLPEGVIQALVGAAETLPSPHSEIFLIQMGGAMGKVAPDATAYPNRGTNFILNIHTRWERPEEDERCVAWTRDLFQAIEPHATGGVYVNFMPQDEVARIHGAYGRNYERLLGIKERFDPSNLFRTNQNIRANGAAPAVPSH